MPKNYDPQGFVQIISWKGWWIYAKRVNKVLGSLVDFVVAVIFSYFHSSFSLNFSHVGATNPAGPILLPCGPCLTLNKKEKLLWQYKRPQLRFYPWFRKLL